jgi:hypothetical protein
MWTPSITLIALVLLALITAAAVTLTITDPAHRALTVPKMLLAGSLGTGGVFAVIVRLHHTGAVVDTERPP